MWSHVATVRHLLNELEDAKDTAAAEQLPDLGSVEDRDDVELDVADDQSDGGDGGDSAEGEGDDGGGGDEVVSSSGGDSDADESQQSSAVGLQGPMPKLLTTTASGLPLEPFKQFGTPSPRWCGGATPRILPWRPNSKTASGASWLSKGGRGGVGSGGRRDLMDCVRQSPHAIHNCGKAAMAAARKMPSMRALDKMGQFPFAKTANKAPSCAVVGNAGHLVKKPYGSYIDNHDLVIRFNLVSVRFSAGRASGKGDDGGGGGDAANDTDSNTKTNTVVVDGREYERRQPLVALERNVGQRTHVRFLNKARASYVCGGRLEQRLKPIGELRAAISWHPEAMKGKTLAACRRKFGNIPIDWGGHPPEEDIGATGTTGTTGIALSEIGADEGKLKALMKPIYNDLKSLRLRGMKNRFLHEAGLTSGAQAVLMALSVCDHVSIYGLSSFNVVQYGQRGSGPSYHYAGRGSLRISGHKFHDWTMEAGAWRLLFAAGKISICST